MKESEHLFNGHQPGYERNSTNDAEFFQTVKGISAVFLSTFLVVTSTSCVQLLKRQIPDFELNTLRLLSSLVFFSIGTAIKRQWPVIPKSEVGSTTCYFVLYSVSSIGIYVSVTLAPVSSVDSLKITSSVVSGLVLFSFFWDERITLARILLAMLCICGVILVVQPHFIFKSLHSNEEMNISSNYTISPGEGTFRVTPAGNVLGHVIPIVSGVVLSMGFLLSKKYPFLGEHKMRVLFWCCFMGSITSAVTMVIFERPVLPTTWSQYLLTGIHCLTFVIRAPLPLYSLQYISGNTFNVVHSTTVVLLLVCQYTVLSSILPGNRNWMEVVGVVLVLFGSALGSVIELSK